MNKHNNKCSVTSWSSIIDERFKTLKDWIDWVGRKQQSRLQLDRISWATELLFSRLTTQKVISLAEKFAFIPNLEIMQICHEGPVRLHSVGQNLEGDDGWGHEKRGIFFFF